MCTKSPHGGRREDASPELSSPNPPELYGVRQNRRGVPPQREVIKEMQPQKRAPRTAGTQQKHQTITSSLHIADLCNVFGPNIAGKT